jgi:hypothetical protein
MPAVLRRRDDVVALGNIAVRIRYDFNAAAA